MGLKETLDFEMPGRINLSSRRAIERIVNQLISLKEAGEAINPGSLKENNGRLYDRMKNQSGGWSRMVSLAGFDPDEENGAGIKKGQQENGPGQS